MTLPEIKNKKLFIIIQEKMNKIKNDFLTSIQDETIQPNILYYLYISYQTFSDEQYVSYVFFIDTYTGGAHPNHQIWTIVFDKTKEEVVTLDDFINKESNFLTKISKTIRSELLINPKMVNTNMMMEGTRPKKENYQNFVITKQGILFFFPPYQVGPYSSGTFKAIYSF